MIEHSLPSENRQLSHINMEEQARLDFRPLSSPVFLTIPFFSRCPRFSSSHSILQPLTPCWPSLSKTLSLSQTQLQAQALQLHMHSTLLLLSLSALFSLSSQWSICYETATFINLRNAAVNQWILTSYNLAHFLPIIVFSAARPPPHSFSIHLIFFHSIH